MATQRCPKCKSKRIRMGYRPTSIFLKLIFRYHLLCDACNWEFTGFGIPGTVAKKTRKRKDTNQNSINNGFEKDSNLNLIDEILDNNKTEKTSATQTSTQLKNVSDKPLEQTKVSLIEQATKTEEIKNQEINNELSNSNLKRHKIKKRVKVKLY